MRSILSTLGFVIWQFIVENEFLREFKQANASVVISCIFRKILNKFSNNVTCRKLVDIVKGTSVLWLQQRWLKLLFLKDFETLQNRARLPGRKRRARISENVSTPLDTLILNFSSSYHVQRGWEAGKKSEEAELNVAEYDMRSKERWPLLSIPQTIPHEKNQVNPVAVHEGRLKCPCQRKFVKLLLLSRILPGETSRTNRPWTLGPD